MEDSRLVTVYITVMKVIGAFVVIVGAGSLYLIGRHSGKIGHQYQRALFVHQSLSWFSYLVLNVGYVPMNMPPYAVVYAEGFLKNICPGMMLMVVQQISFLVGITSRALLFHLRVLAVLPSDHLFGQWYVFYPMAAYYFVPSVLVSLILMPIACSNQELIKEEYFETFKLFHDQFFDPKVIAFPMKSTAMDIWIYATGFGIGSIIIITVTFAARTLTALNNLKINMSEKTRVMHRKLTINLIIQTVFYNLFIVALALVGLLIAFVFPVNRESGRAVFVTIVLTYSTSFLVGSVLMIATDDSYRHATSRAYSYILENTWSHPSSVSDIEKRPPSPPAQFQVFQRVEKPIPVSQ